jgi:phosphoribosylformylglycinamidine (FGAM) synthase-like amidotransferase family enzyme
MGTVKVSREKTVFTADVKDDQLVLALIEGKYTIDEGEAIITEIKEALETARRFRDLLQQVPGQ